MLRPIAATIALPLVLALAGCGADSPLESKKSGSQPAVAATDKFTSRPAPRAAAMEAPVDAKPAEAPLASQAPAAAEGVGPGQGGDKHAYLEENPFVHVADAPLSTFSVDVDTASYAKVRAYLLDQRSLPPPDAVRIEELVNYFDYDYSPPASEHPFAVHLESAACPWQPKHRLVRCGIQGKLLDQQRPPSNLVFLIDVSGSMDAPNKLPLVKEGLQMLVRQLGENDRVAIVVYAGAAGLVLPSTSGQEQSRILSALDELRAGGSTNGGQGIHLAYRVAQENFIKGGTNRVILCSDGDFNVGVTSTGDLVRLAIEKSRARIFLSVLGFGFGNHNDEMLEQIADKADGNYAFIDTQAEARKVLVEQMSGTLVTIAKDVKIQVEFNPAQVGAYRLIGYENRLLAARDFNDDTKDAGEIGAGHRVTAFYEIVPVGIEAPAPLVDPLKYQPAKEAVPADKPGPSSDLSSELLTLKLRYQPPEGGASTLLTIPVKDSGHKFGQATSDFQFAAAVASFGMLLRESKFGGDTSFAAVLETAASACGADRHGYRAEFLDLVRSAERLSTEKSQRKVPESWTEGRVPSTTTGFVKPSGQSQSRLAQIIDDGTVVPSVRVRVLAILLAGMILGVGITAVTLVGTARVVSWISRQRLATRIGDVAPTKKLPPAIHAR